MRVTLSIAVSVLLATTCGADSVVYMRVHRSLIEENLRLNPATQADRVQTLRRLFQVGGCPQVLEQQVPGEQFPNLICLIPGNEPGTILLSASSDDPRDPTLRNWGPLAMLALAVESLANVPHRYTLMLAAFTGHANGNRGGSWYLDHLSEPQHKSILAAINVDPGDGGATTYAISQSDSVLDVWIDVAANALQQPKPHVDRPEKVELISSTTEPFTSLAVPTMVLRPPLVQIPPPATERAMSLSPAMAAYEDAYQLVCVFTIYLDRNLGHPLILPGAYTGRIIDTAGVFAFSPIDTIVDFTRFTSSNELYRYETILQKNGQEGLADALHDESDIGTLRFGVGVATSIKMVVRQESKEKKSYLLVVATRSRRRGGTPRDFRFTVLRLDLDGTGSGHGRFYSTARLRIKNRELEIEDFGSPPELIQQVRLLPSPAPATQPSETERIANITPASQAKAAQFALPALIGKPAEFHAAKQGETTVIPTFRSHARLVQVDVVVMDSHDQPIRGLQARDFTVLEDGKPQPIRYFEAHVLKAASTPASVAEPALPADTYTNRVSIPEDQPLSILLLDLPNTPVTDQDYARKEVLESLKTGPPRARVAMFVLAGNLMLVQDFASDPETLLTAAQRIMSDRSLLLTTEVERQEFKGNADALTGVAAPAGAPGGQRSWNGFWIFPTP
jgi:hypothetical protein